jgi:hypothetical protein
VSYELETFDGRRFELQEYVKAVAEEPQKPQYVLVSFGRETYRVLPHDARRLAKELVEGAAKIEASK